MSTPNDNFIHLPPSDDQDHDLGDYPEVFPSSFNDHDVALLKHMVETMSSNMVAQGSRPSRTDARYGYPLRTTLQLCRLNVSRLLSLPVMAFTSANDSLPDSRPTSPSLSLAVSSEAKDFVFQCGLNLSPTLSPLAG